jgi:hypothetical protein
VRSGDRIARDRVMGTSADRGISTHTTEKESWTTAPGSPASPILACWGGGALGCVVAFRRLTALFRNIRATLREIFDENAYDRFLLRTQEARSVESYREFMREREAGMAKRPRCC